MTEPKTPKNHAIKHLQTLVELNNSAGMGRRDAAFLCLIDYTESSDWADSMVDPTKRLKAYCHCLKLLKEAFGSTKRSAIQFEHQSMIDRPVVHVLKLLLELASAMQSLVTHIIMVEREAENMRGLLGDEASNLLLTTCDNFSDNEARTRASFVKMLPVGKALLESNTAHHRVEFTADEVRRYGVSYEEYRRHYSESLNDDTIDESMLPEGGLFIGMK